MLITEIQQQKNNTDRYSVFIDGVFAFGLILSDIQYFKLKEGQEISQSTFDYINDTLVYIKAQDMALHYISYQMRTVAQVRKKLEDAQYSLEIIERVLDFCQKYHYTDDLQFAAAYIKQRQRLNPKGKYALKAELKQKGVPDGMIEQAIAEAEEAQTIDEAQTAYVLLTKKVKNLDNIDEKDKKRLWGFLQRRGFSYDIIKEAWRQLQQEQE